MSGTDPQPVDIDGDFALMARTVMQKLVTGDAPVATGDQQARLIQRALCASPWLLATLEDPEWQLSVRQAKVPVPVETHEKVTSVVAGRIKPGDILNVSYYKLPHKVVVESCSLIGREHHRMVVKAIHYGRLSLLHSVTVMRDEFQFDCDGASAWLLKFPNAVCYTSEETLARATGRLGEKQHHPLYNNAATFALWCRVRDHQKNKASVVVPRCNDNGRVLHELMPTDHIEIPLLKAQLHGVISKVQSLDEPSDRKLLSIVALTEDLAQLSKSGVRAFARKVLTMSPANRLERVQVEFQGTEVQRNADRYAGVSLYQNYSDLQALAFLATGSPQEPKGYGRFKIDVSETRAGHVILHDERTLFVLAVRRPEQPGQSYQIETVQYAPLELTDATKTSEFRLILSLNEIKQLQLVRHNEPDLQCPVLMSWKVADSPLVNENVVKQVADLKPGDAVCIREDTTAYPLASQMPGLHAIVKTVVSTASGDDASASSQNPDDHTIEVICYTDVNGPDDKRQIVGVRRVPVKGHKFSILVFNVHHNLLATRDEALQRALTRLETGQYCCSWSNSRDLVRWCCVNHKANVPTYLGEVRGVNDVLSMTGLGSGRLRLQQTKLGNGSLVTQHDVRIVGTTSCDECVDLVKLIVSNVNWKPSCVQIVKIEAVMTGARVSRVRYHDENTHHASSGQITQFRDAIINKLLNASLVNASDCRLGAGVTDEDFCSWLLRCRRPGLSELPLLLSIDPTTADSSRRQGNEPISDPGCLRRWDHVVIDRPQARPLHLLVLNFDSESGVLCGSTYGPVVGPLSYDPNKQLDMFVYFPPASSTHPMFKVVQRSSVCAEDAGSEFSASLAAASQFPDDATAWAQMAVLELESDLLLGSCTLNNLLKSLLQFAFRVAAKEIVSDGSLAACRETLASAGLADKLNNAAGKMEEVSTRRLYFLVHLITCLVHPVDVTEE